jgi:hypothetical protein
MKAAVKHLSVVLFVLLMANFSFVPLSVYSLLQSDQPGLATAFAATYGIDH